MTTEHVTITLCGSARFEQLFHVWNEALSISGYAVFSLSVFPSNKRGIKDWYDVNTKKRLDHVHKLKILRSNCIVVLNRFGYIGDSTLSEIEYSRRAGRPVYFLESWGEGMRSYSGRKLDIPENYLTPIDTTTSSHPLNRCIWNLLGPPGVVRTNMVKLVRSWSYDE